MWIPDVARLSSSHVGGSMAGGPPRAVWHRTAGGSFDSNATFLKQEGYEPHLLWDPNTGQIGQFLPLDVSAYALAHPAGTVDTNRMGTFCVQIEVVDNGQTWNITDTPMTGLDVILGQLDALGIPRVWPAGPPSPLGQSGNRDPAIWTKQAGHYGHCHVPGNDHTDPGVIDLARFTGTAPEGDDMTPDECRAVVHEELQYLLGAIEGQPNSKFRQSPVANLLKMQTTLEAIAAKLGIKP